MLLGRGADPSKGQRPPGNASDAWRSALRVAAICRRPKIVEILLQSPRLASFIENVDYYGENALHLDYVAAPAEAHEIANKIYWACRGLEAETGIDHFQAMLAAKNVILHTPIDNALRSSHKGLSNGHVAKVDEIICRYVRELTAGGRRTVSGHKHLMVDLPVLLLLRGGYDQQAVRISQTSYIDLSITETKGRFVDTVACTIYCDACDDSDGPDGDEQEVLYCCRFCGLDFCQNCVDKIERGHQLVRIPFVKDRGLMDFNSDGINQALDVLKTDFVVRQKPVSDGKAATALFEVDPGSDDTTLSLASLHAFGYLEFRRRAWSPYLALAPAVYKRIQPWEPAIEQARRGFQEWVWDTEMSSFRLRGELCYFLEAGKRMAYSDLETIQREQIIRDIPRMFAQPERFSN
ncbi:hypothetical protein LX36DRAFT_579654 [Colletotrichum falcatum]|nr:hypothetical protein LX36DRAFT_579654 [Colletotrichum falcatum]